MLHSLKLVDTWRTCHKENLTYDTKITHTTHTCFQNIVFSVSLSSSLSLSLRSFSWYYLMIRVCTLFLCIHWWSHTHTHTFSVYVSFPFVYVCDWKRYWPLSLDVLCWDREGEESSLGVSWNSWYQCRDYLSHCFRLCLHTRTLSHTHNMREREE